MRITRRPAWPVVFLLAAAAHGASGLESLERLNEEIRAWKRIRKPETAEAMEALERAHGRATAEWTRRWPGEELAWRERLRSLARGAGTAEEVERALDGAERTRGARPGLRFPEDTRFLMAEAAVRGRVRLEAVEGWLSAAVESVRESSPQGGHPLEVALARERLSKARWRAAEIRAEAARLAGDAEGLAACVRSLAAESAVPALDPADRLAALEKARRRMGLFLWHARLAGLRGDTEAARRYYERALEARPVEPGEDESPAYLAMLAEAAEAGARPGGGTPIPPAASAGPHWLPTAQALEGFASDGRPAVAVVWASGGERLERAAERLRKRNDVRILTFAGARVEWIRAVNPLYTAPQLWIVDRGGVIRMVGRLQPGGDGWEDAVTGAALRLAHP